MKKKFFASLASLTIVLGAVLLFNFMSTNSEAASLPRDCDNNSIIYCGATTPDELKKFYKENKTGDLPAVYNHYGISAAMINGVSNANLGEVHKDGRITLNGKVVATGASSIGRKDVYKPSTKLTINGKTYFEHEPKSTFGVESIKAWVFLGNDGKFIGAILTSCGNPFTGKPTPVPTYKCDSLAASKLSREEYTFTAKASAANGATIAGYTYDFGDGQKTSGTSTTTSHTYAKAGTYTAKLTVSVTVNGKTVTATAPSCEVKVVIEDKPAEPTYKCDGLTAAKVSREKYNFTAKASAANGAAITGYVYDFGDGQKATSTATTASHTYAKAGTYTAKLTVNVTVNGKIVTATAPSCEVKVVVENEPEYKCDALAARVIKLEDRSYAYDLSYTAKDGATLKTVDYDFGDGQSKKDVTAAETKNVTHAYAKAGTYKTVATLHFNIGDEVKDVKCETSIKISPEMCPLNPSLPKDDAGCAPCEVPGKEQFPKDSPECAAPCDVPGKEHLPKNSPDCVTPPVAELPHTGPAEMIGGGLGLGSLIAAGYYWIVSRRSLMSALLER